MDGSSKVGDFQMNVSMVTVNPIPPDPTPIPPDPATGADGDWPDASNRPSISGNVLTWVGPQGGGPNNGNPVKQTRTLGATTSGMVNSSSNGQVIEGIDTTGGMIISHNNVTVRQSRIRKNTPNDNAWLIQVTGSGCVIEDCLITNAGHQQGGVNIGWNQLTTSPRNIIRRCNVFGVENHTTTGTNFDTTDNWYHGSTGPDADMVELYGAGSSGGSQNVVVRHNTFDGRDTASGAYLNSGVNCTNDFGGPVKNIQIDGNRFIQAGGYFNICDDNSHSSGTVQIAATNNGFYGNLGFRRDGVTCNPNSGNYVLTSVDKTVHSGSPTNGNGTI
jgi:hypothetical protein